MWQSAPAKIWKCPDCGSLCGELGGKGSRLIDKVKDLTDRGTFDEVHCATAQAVRLFGNYGAHPNDDLLDEIDDRRAEQVLRLAVDLLGDISRATATSSGPAGVNLLQLAQASKK
jgi:hypothetical protein